MTSRPRPEFLAAGVLATGFLAIAHLPFGPLPPHQSGSTSDHLGAGVGVSASQVGQSAAGSTTTVVAVGDIACPPGGTRTTTRCRQADTAKRTSAIDPTYVLLLGDIQYEKGAYSDFMGSFDKSWGALRGKIKPLPGNHEYDTSRADGYYRYFSRAQRPGYYAFDVNGWRVYMLNSNCGRISCTTENTWLAADLAQHPTRCSLIATHHPRYSSGREHGSSTIPRPFWRTAYRHHVDIALAGHDHDYERFLRKDGDGHRQIRGILSYVSGAGGKSLYTLGTRKPGSQVFRNSTFGVLKLVLGETGWSWNYVSAAGRSLDSGSRGCV